MKKDILDKKVDDLMSITKDSLQMLWDNINKGQQKQIIKNEKVKEMFDRYGVEYE